MVGLVGLVGEQMRSAKPWIVSSFALFAAVFATLVWLMFASPAVAVRFAASIGWLVISAVFASFVCAVLAVRRSGGRTKELILAVSALVISGVLATWCAIAFAWRVVVGPK